MSDTVVKITKLVKRYKELVALDNFNLEIKKGEVIPQNAPVLHFVTRGWRSK